MLCNINYSNVAEAMVSKGYATVIRYRQDDDQRSSHYDELLAAEMKATKSGAGVHAKKNIPNHHVNDVSGVRHIIFQSAEKNFVSCFIAIHLYSGNVVPCLALDPRTSDLGYEVTDLHGVNLFAFLPLTISVLPGT